MVKSCDGYTVETINHTLSSRCVIWTAGVKANKIKGIIDDRLGRAGRIITDPYSRVCDEIYAIGDIAYMITESYPNGHPQIAPVAMQKADNLAFNFIESRQNKTFRPFEYNDKGSMATVGRNLAVVELNRIKFGGFFAWLVWIK